MVAQTHTNKSREFLLPSPEVFLLDRRFEHGFTTDKVYPMSNKHDLYVQVFGTTMPNGNSLEKYITDLSGVRCTPSFVVCTKAGKAPDPFKLRHRSTKDRLPLILPIRVSLASNHVVLSDWRDPCSSDKSTRSAEMLHIFFEPIPCGIGSEGDGAAPTANSDTASAMIANSQQMDKLKSTSKELMDLMDVLDSEETDGLVSDVGLCEHHGFDKNCQVCVQAGLRTMQRRRNKGVVKHGVISFDIALYSKSGPYVLVGIVTNKNDKSVMLVEPIEKKNSAELRRAITTIMVQMAWKYDVEVFTRIHSDRERGLEGLHQEFQEKGIWCTTTIGRDPTGNGRAESAVNIVSIGARQRLMRFDKETTRKALWSSACVHAAQTWSERSLGSFDINKTTPFGASVEARWPPKTDLQKAQSRTYSGIYLHKSSQVTDGHVIARITKQKGSPIISETRIARTFRVVQEDEKIKIEREAQTRGKRRPGERHAIINVETEDPDVMTESIATPRDDVMKNPRPA